MSPELELTPLMKQYWELKSQAKDALLLFRMGDFYELFADDAIEASRILEITLTSRDKNKANPMPMAGVPFHSVQSYLQKLLNAGKKVAIGEQVGDPALVKGKSIVERRITRLLTPGVQFETEGSSSQYLAALVPAVGLPDQWVLSCIDASTGEALVGLPCAFSEIEADLVRLPIRHLLTQGAPKLSESQYPPEKLLIEHLPSNYLGISQAQELLKKQFEVENLSAFISDNSSAHALGVALQYLLRSQQKATLPHLRLPVPLHQPETLTLGPRSAQHLDLLPNLDGAPSLFQLINKTRSALGARKLRRYLLAPLKNTALISARQDKVKAIFQERETAQKISSELSLIYDIERILGRVNTGLANPRDTLALGKSIASLTQIAKLLIKMPVFLLPESKEASRLTDELKSVGAEILRTQKDDAPLVSRDGGIFAVGADPELDRLISLTENGQRWLIELETREREATGISSLKVRYNRVFGYYIEITQSHLKNVPSHYQRKQTTVGAERFFTEELKKFEDEIIHASTKQKALEQELFKVLLEKIALHTKLLMEAASLLGELDALSSLARLLDESVWNFPEINDSLDFQIQGGRHPMVDSATRGMFVPNDLELSPQTRLTLVITGPNMGGKSTIMRQVALIIILGQMGAPVPATRASWGVFSSVHTRIGAHDSIARGQSTFMVEMSELAHILHHADERSLIILDEIGRGTSTYDGMSVAWSTLEWISKQIQARTLFATHYHELTKLSNTLPLMANAHMSVEGARGASSLRFTYKLEEGPTNESFGIHVARIAGLPKSVIERSWQVLEELEAQANPLLAGAVYPGQMSLFGGMAPIDPSLVEPLTIIESHPVVEEIQKANVNEMTPIQALNFVLKLQEISKLKTEA